MRGAAVDPLPTIFASFSAALAAADKTFWDGTLPVLAENLHEYLESQVPVVRSQSAVHTDFGGGGGSITQEQFSALNQCEASGRNGWRTGRYGLETGTGDVGSWSLEQQQAKAQQVFNDFGASAWGVMCRGILGG